MSDPVRVDHQSDLGRFMLQRQRLLGLTVTSVCKRVGMAREAWYRLVRGETAAPAVRTLCRLAAVYQVSPIDLIELAYPECKSRVPAPVAVTAASD